MTTKEAYEGFDALLDAICKNSDDVDYDLEFVRERIEKLPEYFNVVVTSELSIKMAYVRYEDDIEQLHETVENIDRKRREKHISLTDSINVLNRMCDMYNVPHIFETGRDKDLKPELKEDREIATDLCYTFCRDVFLDAKAKEAIKEDMSLNPTTKQRDDELYRIANSRQGTFHHEVMKNVEMAEVKTGSVLQSLIEKAEAMEKPKANNRSQGAQTYDAR